jgi:hypothetical protein
MAAEKRGIPVGVPHSRGLTQLVKHRKGVQLTQRQATLAKCCDCMGYHVDGRVDCRIPACPLYPFMPYREKGPGISPKGSLVASEQDSSPRTAPGASGGGS